MAEDAPHCQPFVQIARRAFDRLLFQTSLRTTGPRAFCPRRPNKDRSIVAARAKEFRRERNRTFVAQIGAEHADLTLKMDLNHSYRCGEEKYQCAKCRPPFLEYRIENQAMTDDHHDYIDYCRERRGLSQHSLRAYTQDLTSYCKWESLQDDGPFVDEDEALIYFHQQLRKEDMVSPATARRRIVTLKAFFKWRAKRDNKPSRSFADLELDLRLPRRLPRPIERGVLAEVLTATPHIVPRSHCLSTSETAHPANQHQTTGLAVRLLISTGVRIGELTNLSIRDVLGTGGRIRVHGKGDRERFVYVTNDKLLADLNTYAAIRLEKAKPTDPLLVNVNGRRLSEAAFRKRLRKISEVLQLPSYVTPHQFRHSAATMLIEEGVDIRLVQRLLGHASITTTEIYTKVSDTSLKSAIERADTLATVDTS